MLGWDVEVWVQVVFGVITAVISCFAIWKSQTADARAVEANEIAKEANAIARRALEVQERGVEHQIESHSRTLRADIRVSPGPRGGRQQRAEFQIENRGPGDAEVTLVQFRHNDRVVSFDRATPLPPGRPKPWVISPGRLVELFKHDSEFRIEMLIRYTDGVGDHTLRKLIVLGPGPTVQDRELTIQDWSGAA